jgi:hypothetical protein
MLNFAFFFNPTLLIDHRFEALSLFFFTNFKLNFNPFGFDSGYCTFPVEFGIIAVGMFDLVL